MRYLGRFVCVIEPKHVERVRRGSCLLEDFRIRAAIGTVLPGDIGKEVYEVAPGVYQVENDEQRDARLCKSREEWAADGARFTRAMMNRKGMQST